VLLRAGQEQLEALSGRPYSLGLEPQQPRLLDHDVGRERAFHLLARTKRVLGDDEVAHQRCQHRQRRGELGFGRLQQRRQHGYVGQPVGLQRLDQSGHLLRVVGLQRLDQSGHLLRVVGAVQDQHALVVLEPLVPAGRGVRGTIDLGHVEPVPAPQHPDTAALARARFRS